MPEKLPEFPNFRLFTINDITWYHDYYLKNGLSPYADISPYDLFVWLNFNNDLAVSELNDGITFCYTNILDNNQNNIIPLANPLSDSIIEKVMLYLKENNLPLELHEIPSIICNELDQNKWQIEDDRNSYEYILDTSQQLLLEGSDFSRQRRRVNFFEREHSSDTIDVQYYQEIDNETKEVFLHFISAMPFNSNEESSQQNYAEPIAIRNNLEQSSVFHKEALIVRINGEIASFAIISHLGDKTVAINHLEANYSVQYIFQYTIYQLAKILKEDGIDEMNIEQDLGIEGIRIFKERLQPSRFLEKKIIRPRHQ